MPVSARFKDKVLLSVAVSVLIGPVAFGAPKLELGATRVDFGPLMHGTAVDRRLRFRNAGDEPLTITAVRSSCPSCSVPSRPPESIAPGQEDFITLTYQAKGAVGDQRAVLYIHSNDPVEPEKTITITATIVSPDGAPRLSCNPAKLDLGVISVRQASMARLALGNGVSSQKALKIEGVTASEGCVVLKPFPREIAPGQKQALSVEVFAREPGVVREWVNIETNDPVTPIVNVPIEGYAVKDAGQPAPSQQNGLFLQLIGDAVAVPGTGGKFRQELLILNQTAGQVKVKFPQASGSLANAKPATLTLKPGQPEIVDLELDPEQVGKSESVRIEIEYPVVEK